MQTTYERTGKLQRKIDIFYAQGRVNGSLQWAATCKEAKSRWLETHPDVNPAHVRARFGS